MINSTRGNTMTKLSIKDQDIIKEIATRYHGLTNTPIGITMMDLTACHMNGCPLKLAELLGADKGNLCHDVGGINAHLDHETYELSNFVPRYSV